MVQIETAQLSAACNSWRDTLRQYRDELTQQKLKLQDSATHRLSKDQLLDVEHLHNQFHIQLINIHDLKHSIKSHCKMMEYEINVYNGKLREETKAMQKGIYAQFQLLDLTLKNLKQKFNNYMLSVRH